MRVVFIGASGFGALCLEKVMTMVCCEVVGIVTNKETFSVSYRPEGLTNVLYSDLGLIARKNNIPLFIMEDKMTNPKLIESIRGWSPDFILVVGWYHMVPKAIRDIAPAAGLHASLLPDYRGGAPLVWAIINGEERTGITFFMFDDGVDSGPIIGQKAESIYRHDTIATLYSRIEKKGIELIEEYLPGIAEGRVELRPQDAGKGAVMPQRKPEDGEIDWCWDALRIYNFIRAQTKPYPGAFTFLNDEKLTVWEAKLFDCVPDDLRRGATEPGTILGIINAGASHGLLVSTVNKSQPLLLSIVGCKEKDMVSGVECAKMKDMRGEIFGKHIP